MTRMGNIGLRALGIVAVSLAAARGAAAQTLTADAAVQLALKNNTQIIGAEASVLDARSGVYGAYSGVLPRVSGSLTRRGSWQEANSGSQIFGGQVFFSPASDNEQYSTSPALSGSWNVLNLSSLTGLSSARQGLRAAQHQRRATRQDVAFSTRRQFYEVVRAEKLATVANGAARLARDDERRVNALFQVGSVSRSDLLKAQVRTAQSQLDSLTAHQAVTNQRIVLAQLLGVRETQMGEVDTLLTFEPRSFEREALLAEAAKQRPDLVASEADLKSARANVRSAQFARLPYLALTGGLTYKPRSTFKQSFLDTNVVESGNSESDLEYSASVSLNLDIFNGFLTESRIASARARQLRAQEASDALHRNLESEVDQALLAYNEAAERNVVASSAVESAIESLKLTQQKYNVGSSTILELIDAQVQLQRALSDQVSAQAAIRVAEAQINRVRGLE